jgi:phage-related protein
VVPTLQNSPASSWNTTALKDSHVGDVYFVVNSESQQNGYNYRFTKSGSTYSWQLIKDSDVTNALQRLNTAEGKISTFDTDISQLKIDTGTLTTKTTSLETRMSDAEADILDKVDTTTFNEVSDTVDSHSQSISQMSTTLSNKADSSTVSAVTQRVSKNEQDISGINTTIGQLQTTVESKADGSTVETMSTKLNTVSDTVDGHTQSISSITSTQTTMQGKLDKTLVETTQLWFSKANTTAPNKPTAQVTSTSTEGNAWRVVVPAYNASYPNYYYCYQWKYSDGTYGWSSVTRDIAMGESQERARTAITNAANAQADIDGLEIGGRNLAFNTAGAIVDLTETPDGSGREYFAFDLGQALPFGAGTPIVISFDLYMPIKTSGPSLQVYNTNNKGPHQTLMNVDVLSGKSLPVGSIVNERIVIETSVHADRSDATRPHDYLEFYSKYGSNNYYRISNLKLEKGNRATDWTPAPEDVDADISTAQTSADNAQATANKNIKESQQLWFTKVNDSAPNKPTSKVTSTSTGANAWTTKVPTYNASSPYYFYCMQYVAADGTVTWSDVIYDRATTEAQSVARTASANLSTLQQDYATFKQTTQQFESTIGTTYATKTELGEAVDNRVDVDGEFLYRATGGGQDVPSGRATVTSIHGKTVVWNQLAPVPFRNQAAAAGITYTTNSDGSVSLSGTATKVIYERIGTALTVVGHKYVVYMGGTIDSSSDLYIYNDGGGINTGASNKILATVTAAKSVFVRIANGATVDGTIRPQIFDLTQMFGAGNEPATVAEFEALFPEPYYPYDAGSLLPVRMTGVETVGFNQWDTDTSGAQYLGHYYIEGETYNYAKRENSDYDCYRVPVFPSTEYCISADSGTLGSIANKRYVDASSNFISGDVVGWNALYGVFTTPSTAKYIEVSVPVGTTKKLCINLSSPRNGTYEPHWSSQRAIPAIAENFPDGMRSAGSVYDELTASEAITRVGSVDLGTLTWTAHATYAGMYIGNGIVGAKTGAWNHTDPNNVTVLGYMGSSTMSVVNNSDVDKTITIGNRSGEVWIRNNTIADATALASSLESVMLHYALDTPTITPIDPALNLTYKAEQGGTERIMVDATLAAPQSAPVPMLVQYGINIYDMAAEDALRTASIESRVTNAETSITQNKNDIALRAKSSDVYTKTQTDGLISTEVTNRNAAITAKANEITSSVSETYTTKEEFENLEIGGRNLLQDSKFTKAFGAGWWVRDGLSATLSDNKLVIDGSVAATGNKRVYQSTVRFSHVKNITYTFSCDIVATAACQVSFGRRYGTTNHCGVTFDVTTTSQRISGTYTATYAGAFCISGVSNSATVTISNPKLEIGNKATDWTPAPEDIETRITTAESSITQNAQNIESKVSKDGVISSINQSAESVKIQASKVEIDGTAVFNAISDDVDDAITGKGYQTASQVNTAITSKGYATTTQAQGYASTAEQNAKTYAEGQADAVNSALETYKTTTNSTLTSLQNQVDGQIEAWYKTVDPTLSNEPASTWNTDALKARHEGDIYYNVESGHSWRWMKSGSTYSWQQIPDSDAAAALAVAQNAQSLANSKRRIFTSTPTVPYDVGDLWVDGTSIKYANASKTDSQTYSESDWAVTATDDTLAQTALDAAGVVQDNLNAARIWYAESTTPAGTVAKVATITPETTAFELTVGTIVNVKFSATNSGAVGSITLNVNETGAKHIKSINKGVVGNLPGAGYITANTVYQFIYDGSYWVAQSIHPDANSTYNLATNNYYKAIKAKAAITAEHIIVGDSSGYSMVAAGTTFDLSYPILWCTAAVKLNASNYTNLYLTVQERTILNSAPNLTKVLGSTVWLTGTISGDIFTVSSDIATCEAPTTEDGLIYIPIGCISSTGLSTKDFMFVSSKELWAYVDGAFRQVDTSTVLATHRIYYRTATANSSLAAPTTWVEEATGNVYNQWTTKVPPLAVSTASGQTKYLYLYTCEQRKRLDGTTVCTKVLLDENTTVIDGGNIITGSVTANKLNAADINASKSLTVGAMTDDAASTILNSNLSNDISNATKTATNYITADSTGIRIANTNPTTATTYQHQTATETEFVVEGKSMGSFSGTSVRIGSESDTHVEIEATESNGGHIVLSNPDDASNGISLKMTPTTANGGMFKSHVYSLEFGSDIPSRGKIYSSYYTSNSAGSELVDKNCYIGMAVGSDDYDGYSGFGLDVRRQGEDGETNSLSMVAHTYATEYQNYTEEVSKLNLTASAGTEYCDIMLNCLTRENGFKHVGQIAASANEYLIQDGPVFIEDDSLYIFDDDVPYVDARYTKSSNTYGRGIFMGNYVRPERGDVEQSNISRTDMIAGVFPYAMSNADVGVTLEGARVVNGTRYTNALRLGVNESGGYVVRLQRAPWLSALGLGETSPTNLSLNSATKAYSSSWTPKYRKWGNVVEVYGAVSPKAVVAAEGTLTIATLPTGYRPSSNVCILCQGSGVSQWFLTINPNGVMEAARYRSGSTYAAMQTNSFLVFNATFIVD